jgi:hypothetical protein
VRCRGPVVPRVGDRAGHDARLGLRVRVATRRRGAVT